MNISKLAIGYLLVQGIDLTHTNRFVDTQMILDKAEILEEYIKTAYTIKRVQLIPLDSNKTRFNLTGFPKNSIYTSSSAFNLLDFSQTYDLLIKSVECKEILAYVRVES